MQLDFVELAIFPVSVGDRPLSCVTATEQGDFGAAIIVHLLDAPVALVLAVTEDLGTEIFGLRPFSFGLAHFALRIGIVQRSRRQRALHNRKAVHWAIWV